VAGTVDIGWLWPLLVAPIAGSFLGVLIIRLPAGKKLVFSRSACPHCASQLTAVDLVPLVSFMIARGRCRHCREPIGLFYPTVELAAVVVAAWAVLFEPDPVLVWVDCGLGWTLLTLAWIDWTDMLLPDVLTLPLLLAGLALTFALQPDALVDHSLAAALGYLAFQGLALVYRRLRGRDGLGGGDAKLIAAAGAWCGVAVLPFVVVASAALGLLAALGLALAGRNMTSRTQIPFGPCIALAFWLAWMCGGAVEDLAGMLALSP
jgi:leader peptidase (prepilin peptidase)/N-methyltransferase